MQVTNASDLEFTSDDNATWDAFLRTQTGQRLLPKLAESAPSLLPKGETNEILVRNGMLLGFQLAVQVLLELTRVSQAPSTPVENYPPLDADEYWITQTK